MELFVTNKSATVFKILSSSDIKEAININISPKAASINHFNGNTFGILDQNDLLMVHSLSDDKRLEMSLKTKTNCFLFDVNGAILSGDSLGIVEQFKPGSSTPLFRARPIINDEITSIKASFKPHLVFCRHQSGKMSYFHADNLNTHVLKYNKNVSVFDASKWCNEETLLGARCGDVVHYNIERDEIISQWEKHTSCVVGATFSICNKLMALSVSEDRTSALLGIDNGKIIQVFAHKNVPTACAFDDNFQFAIGDETGSVSIFDIRTKKRTLELKTDGRVTFLDFFYIDQENKSTSASNVLKETQNTTDYSRVSSKSNLSKGSLIKVDYVKDSLKLKMPKNVRKGTDKDNMSSNSLFSGDGSIDAKHPTRNKGFDLSEANVTKKTIKQVKFRDNTENSVTFPTNVKTVTEMEAKTDTKLTSDTDTHVSGDIDKTDYITLKRVIVEEFQKHFAALESRITNDVLFGVVDQLTITENNIVSPLLALVDQNRLLSDENAMLREELRKYKYNA